MSNLKILYFTATWCGPCKVLGPIVTDVVKSMSDDVELQKIDGDENQDLLIAHSVKAFPTLVFQKDGKEVGRHVGLVPKAKLEDLISKAKLV